MAGTALAPARAATTRWLWLSCRKQGLAYNFLSQFKKKNFFFGQNGIFEMNRFIEFFSFNQITTIGELYLKIRSK